MTARPMNEEQMVHLVRNALLVAGQEMGEGDHMPVINDTIHKIMKDWEDLKTERNVHAEVQKHCASVIQSLETLRATCSAGLKPHIDKTLTELRAAYDAGFSPVPADAIYIDEAAIPLHIKRAQHIINILEDSHE